MKKLIINISLITIVIYLFSGCKKAYVAYDFYGEFGFKQTEQIVNVNSNTHSFTIYGNWTEVKYKYTNNGLRHPAVYLNNEKSTAKAGIHFEKYSDLTSGTIGVFIQDGTDENNRKKDIVIYPENIKEEVIILYSIPISGKNLKDKVLEHKVILRPSNI